MEAFAVFEVPRVVPVKLGAHLWWYDDARDDPRNVVLSDRTPEQLVFDYIGTFRGPLFLDAEATRPNPDGLAIVRYEPVAPDSNASSRAMFVKAVDLGGQPVAKAAPAPDCGPAVSAYRAKVLTAVEGVPV